MVTKNVATAISATPDPGCVFTNWTVVAGSAAIADTNAVSTTVAVAGTTTIQANFAIIDTDSDTDGDGMRNRDEILAGTDPTRPDSVLSMAAPLFHHAGSEFVVHWHSVSNRRYSLRAATNLLSGFDLILRTNIPATPPINAYTDTVDGARSRFYRVGVHASP